MGNKSRIANEVGKNDIKVTLGREATMATTVNDAKLKKVLKTALVEVLDERREDFRELFAEAIEDLALVRAIQEGESTKTVPKGSVLKVLKGKQ